MRLVFYAHVFCDTAVPFDLNIGRRHFQRVSGKGNSPCDAIFMFKLIPSYGELFDDKLCSTDFKITVI